MAERSDGIEKARRLYARMMAAASNSADPRLERIFEAVPREAFLGPGPWRLVVNGRPIETPGLDPTPLYQNVLVALDAERGINNGEPFLHAGWIGAVAPQPGETICHVGAGTGYYTAILSMLVLPDGHVTGFEIEPHLAQKARENLEPFEGVEIVTGDATAEELPPCDVLYVNAGVVAPPVAWLRALKPGGRLIFPWRPGERLGLAVLVTRGPAGFSARTLGPCWFIPCIGASDPGDCLKAPDLRGAREIRSIWPSADRRPDATAVAVFRDVWFSRAQIPA